MTEEDCSVEYREIPDHPGYRIGNDGSAWTRKTRSDGKWWHLGDCWKRMRLPLVKGYPHLFIYRDGNPYQFQLHVLVLELFVGPRPDGMWACHQNGVRHDCRVGNLRWDTPAGNSSDREKHGTAIRGEMVWKAKLKEDQVREMRAMSARGLSRKKIAKALQLPLGTVADAVSRATWKHVE